MVDIWNSQFDLLGSSKEEKENNKMIMTWNRKSKTIDEKFEDLAVALNSQLQQLTVRLIKVENDVGELMKEMYEVEDKVKSLENDVLF